jgi:carbamoyl-phosphate synthase large subunit
MSSCNSGGKRHSTWLRTSKQRGRTSSGRLSGIHDAEDREKFSALIGRLGLRQPDNRMAGTPEAVRTAAETIGYPVLLRPSFVLGGRSMTIAYSKDELDAFLAEAPVLSEERPVWSIDFLRTRLSTM